MTERENVGGRVTETFDVRHLGALLESFAVFGHGSASNLVREKGDARKFPH
ncbi:MAG TPA: hypothetical protein VN921_07035 [Chthoniobacterales bacterium]|nr:hypothetical protein [Chthoniobacterales bacterium]